MLDSGMTLPQCDGRALLGLCLNISRTLTAPSRGYDQFSKRRSGVESEHAEYEFLPAFFACAIIQIHIVQFDHFVPWIPGGDRADSNTLCLHVFIFGLHTANTGKQTPQLGMS